MYCTACNISLDYHVESIVHKKGKIEKEVTEQGW